MPVRWLTNPVQRASHRSTGFPRGILYEGKGYEENTSLASARVRRCARTGVRGTRSGGLQPESRAGGPAVELQAGSRREPGFPLLLGCEQRRDREDEDLLACG